MSDEACMTAATKLSQSPSSDRRNRSSILLAHQDSTLPPVMSSDETTQLTAREALIH